MVFGTGAITVTPGGEPGYSLQVRPETALVIRALTEYPAEAELVDIAEYILPGGAVRQNAKRGAKIEFLCPDEVVVSLTGEPEMRGKLLAVWIPAVVLDELRRLVQTPAEAAAGSGPLIVTP